MFSFAGVALSEPEGTEVGEWIAQNIRPMQLFPLAYQTWPGQWFNGPVLNITPEIPCPVRIGGLHWPHDASRFATGYFVVSSQQLAKIRNVVYKGGAARSAPFVFSDGDNSITTNLWMLPAIPLQQAAPGGDFYLIVLVDDRYWWWGQSVDLAVIEGFTSWNDLYTTIGNVLGITFNVDPIASAYGTPVSQYQTGARPLPLILDAIAFSVGQRVVRYRNGDVHIQNPTTSAAIVAANVGATKYAGGAYAFNARSANDLATFPNAVNVAFTATGNGAATTGFYNVPVTLAELRLTQFNNIVGVPWPKLLHRYETAIYAGATDPVNQVALAALAEQLVQDWYLWQLAYLDQYFIGVVEWILEGMHNLEWNQSGQKITTRVQRGVWHPAEDLLIPAISILAFTPKCLETCEGDQICVDIPTSWIKQGPCASGSVPPEEFVTITCQGMTIDVPKQLCLMIQNAIAPSTPPGTGMGCTTLFTTGLTLTFVGFDPVTNTWTWSGSAASGSCSLNFHLNIINNSFGDSCEAILFGTLGGGGVIDNIGQFGYLLAISCVPASTPQTWLVGTTYLANYFVVYGGVYYVAIGDNTGAQPDISPGQWLEVDIADIYTIGPSTFMQFATAFDSVSEAGFYTITQGPCSSPPVVNFSSVDICEDTTTLTIHGANFLPGATVAFTPTGTGTVTYISSNQLNITSLTGISVGALYAVVTCPGTGSSGTPIQVATVEPTPTITINTSNVVQATGNFTFFGTGFIPGSTAVTLSSGTFSIVSVTTTSITVNFTVAPSLGALTATVTTPCGTDSEEVANIVAGGVTVTNVGGGTAASGGVLSFTASPGEDGLLVVSVSTSADVLTSITYDSTPMTIAQTVIGPDGRVHQYFLAVSAGSAMVDITAADGDIEANAVLITGLVGNTADYSAIKGAGGSGNPDTGVSTTTLTAPEVVIACVRLPREIYSGSWAGSFIPGTGDQVSTNYQMYQAYRILNSVGTFQALMVLTPDPASFAIVGVPYF